MPPFGSGFGTPFGGGAVIPLASPLSSVGDPLPITFDFTSDPDGPLPGAWEFFVLSDDGGGNKTSSAEPASSDYFRVVNGLAGWLYDLEPAVPAMSAPFDEHGLLASPQGILQGRNAEIALAFVHPPDLLDVAADEFQFEALVGFRASDDLTSFYGARARASWSSGSWTLPVALELVHAAGMAPAVVTAAAFDALPNPIDAWYGGSRYSEVRVRFRNGALTGWLNGVAELDAAIPDLPGAKPVVLVRAWNRRGALRTPLPCVAALSLQTLRDLVRFGPTPAILGDSELEATPRPVYRLPLTDLSDKGFLKRIGARAWQVVQDVQVDVVAPNEAKGNGHTFSVGTILRIAGEPIGEFRDQELVGVIPDLSAIRAARERD